MNDGNWLKAAKKNAGMLIALGVVQIIVGILAIGSPLVAGVAVALLVGMAFVVAGLVRLVGAFWCDSFGSGVLAFLGGVLALAAGGFMIARPGIAIATMTLFLAFYFLIEGIQRVVLGFQMKPVQGWGWSVFSGVLSLMLGILIWRQFPLSGEWAIGTIVGVHLMVDGWGMVGIGGVARKAISGTQEAAA